MSEKCSCANALRKKLKVAKISYDSRKMHLTRFLVEIERRVRKYKSSKITVQIREQYKKTFRKTLIFIYQNQEKVSIFAIRF